MELVYLWVEEYKNIHHQGFNFSPRFECRYDDVNNELTICDKKGELAPKCKENKYLENFFGDNINVTAIVGKNGSGKSSIAECIAFNHSPKLPNNKSIVVLYYDKTNDFLIHSENIKDIKLKKSNSIYAKIIDFQSLKDDLFNIFYTSGKTWFDPVNDRNQEKLSNIVHEIDISDYTLFEWYAQRIQKDYSHKLRSFIQIWFFSRTQNTLNGLRLFKSNIILPKDLIKPKSVYITIDPSFIRINYHNFISDQGKLRGLSNVPRYDSNEDNEYKLKLTLLQYLIPIMNRDIEVDLGDLNFNTNKEKNDVIYRKINEGWDLIIDEEELKDFNLDRLLTLLSNKQKFDIQSDFDDIQEILNIYKALLGYGKIDFLDFRYDPSPSSGGEQLINLISKVYVQIEEKIGNHHIGKSIVLILDEPDIYLHPNWQKQVIQILISFLKNNYPRINFHIVFTTHSPFLLSDIPKQNIIFLDTDENEKCTVVDGLKEKKETFGANIHTILSDSFFMEDGMMGEFAKSKIDQVIKLLNQETLDENELKYCEQIISIIGEPIVKNQLQRMLDSKRLKKIDQIDKIVEEIELLKHRLDFLRKNK